MLRIFMQPKAVYAAIRRSVGLEETVSLGFVGSEMSKIRMPEVHSLFISDRTPS
jgi:hypothetical protein